MFEKKDSFLKLMEQASKFLIAIIIRSRSKTERTEDI